MSNSELGVVLQHLRRLSAVPGTGPTPDPQLLDDFLAHRDEAAFEELERWC